MSERQYQTEMVKSALVGWSRPRMVGLLGGLLVIILDLFLYNQLIPEEVPLAVLVGVLGVGAIGGAVAAQRPLWERGRRWLERAGQIDSWGLILLYLALPLSILTKLAAGEGPVARHWYVALGCWLLAIGCVWWSGRETAVQKHKAVVVPPQPQQLYQELFIAAFLLLLALFLRATVLDLFPNTVSGDEGSSGLAAVAFKQGTVDNLFVTGWFSFPTFYFAVQNIGIELWGQTATGLRIMSAVAGALTVVGLYGMVRVMYGRFTAVCAALLLAAAHHHIHFSRIGLNNIWDGLFVVLVLGALWQGWVSGRRRWFILSGLMLGLSQYFYGSMRVVPLAILLWAAVAWVWQPLKFKRLFPNFVLTAYASLIVFLPLGLFFFNHPDVFRAPLERVTIFGDWIANESLLFNKTPWQIYWMQLERSISGLFLEPLRMWYTPGEPLLLPAGAVLFCVGVLVALKRLTLPTILLLLILSGNILTMSVTNDVPAAQRYMLAPPLVMVFVALPLGRLQTHLKGQPSLGKYGSFLIPLIITVILMAINLNFYFFEVYDDFVLGGINTEVATQLAYILQEEDSTELTVHFAGGPRMFYNSHSTLPFLVPDIHGRDIDPPLTAAPQEPLTGSNLFVFLPERRAELEFVRQAYPNGQEREVFNKKGELLFVMYRVRG